jgi:hypothetical protein
MNNFFASNSKDLKACASPMSGNRLIVKIKRLLSLCSPHRLDNPSVGVAAAQVAG